MNLVDLSIKRPVFITMITLFLVVVGIISARSLPIDLYPDVSPPVITVRVNFPGASPEEVEELVVKPVEDVVSTVGGVKALRSTSRQAQGFVSLEFEPGQDINFQETQVRAKVAEARRSLPDDIDEPTVTRSNVDDTPIVEFAVSGPRAVSELSDYAENVIAKELRQVQGVGDVSLSGERREEIRVELRPELMAPFRLNASDVVARLRAEATQQPAGQLEGKERVWLLRLRAAASSSIELRDMVVGRTDAGLPVRLGEVADVSESFVRARRFNRFHRGDTSGASVGIEITKQSGVNTLTVASAVQDRLSTIRAALPADVNLDVTSDVSGIIRVNMADVLETLFIAAALTVIVVLLFLQSPRSTLTTAISLPSSVLTTFLIMKAAGFTINTMTLLALTLAIGIIVDDAIVVRENIFRHLSELKKSGLRAASEGTREVQLAVVATTLTLVAVFVPVAGLQSVTGQFFKPFALTVTFAILVSLWDALTMAPMLSAYYANIPSPKDEWARFGPPGRAIFRALEILEHGFEKLARAYGWLVRRLLRLHLVQIVALLISLGLVWWGGVTVRKGFLPSQLGTDFRIQLDGPLAVPAERVNTLLPEIEKRVASTDTLAFFTLSGGIGFSGNIGINIAARVKPEFAKSQDRLLSVRQKIRQALSGIPGYNVRVVEVADPLAGGGGGRFAPVIVNVSADSLADLNDLSRKVTAVMEGVQGLSDVNNASVEGLPEFQVKMDGARAGLLGVPPALVTQNLQTWVQGSTPMYLKKGDTQVPVAVTLKNGFRLGADDILRQEVFVNTAQGVTGVPLSAFASIEAGAGPTQISRENRQRVQRVAAGLAPGAALGDVLPRLQDALAEIPLPQGAMLKVTGQADQMSTFFGELAIALGLGAIFVYMVLASLFESFAHPFTVMMALPLAGSGALLSLKIFNVPLDLYGGIGLVLLAGIVAKNSILLVDMALEMRQHDPSLSPAEAMARTAPKRLRPILMTSIAMIVGMLPIATGLGVGGATRQSLGIGTVGGVVSSTLLSLLIIPSLFVWVEQTLDWFRRRSKKRPWRRYGPQRRRHI